VLIAVAFLTLASELRPFVLPNFGVRSLLFGESRSRFTPVATSDVDLRSRILFIAAAMIDELGEAGLRLARVASEAGVTTGAIAHHFGSRDDLIVAAQLHRLSGSGFADIGVIRAALESCRDVNDFRRLLSELTASVVSRARAGIRMKRVTAVAASHHRGRLEGEIGAVIGDLTSKFSAVIAQAQARDFVRAELQADAVATMVQAYAFGLVLADLDPNRPSEGDLAEVVSCFLDGILEAD